MAVATGTALALGVGASVLGGARDAKNQRKAQGANEALVQQALAYWDQQAQITNSLYGKGLEYMRRARGDVLEASKLATALVGASGRELAKASVQAGQRADAAVKEAGMSRGLGASSATVRARISTGVQSAAQTAGIRAGTLQSMAGVQQQKGAALANVDAGIAGYFAQQEAAKRGITQGRSSVLMGTQYQAGPSMLGQLGGTGGVLNALSNVSLWPGGPQFPMAPGQTAPGGSLYQGPPAP